MENFCKGENGKRDKNVKKEVRRDRPEDRVRQEEKGKRDK